MYVVMFKLSIVSYVCSSKKLQFSLLNPQDTVKLSEYEVTHRDLYTATDRAPVKNGVLDRRLVRGLSLSHTPLLISVCLIGNFGEKCVLRDMRTVLGRLCRSLRLHQALRPCISYWLLQTYYYRPSMYL
jgi:hypothetical protein